MRSGIGGGAGTDMSIDCRTWRHATPELIAEVMDETQPRARINFDTLRMEVATMWTRRTFLEALSTGSLAPRRVTLPHPALNRPDVAQQSPGSPPAEMMREGEIVIERPLAGRPHAGKVLAAIQLVSRLEQYITENAVPL